MKNMWLDIHSNISHETAKSFAQMYPRTFIDTISENLYNVWLSIRSQIL